MVNCAWLAKRHSTVHDQVCMVGGTCPSTRRRCLASASVLWRGASRSCATSSSPTRRRRPHFRHARRATPPKKNLQSHRSPLASPAEQGACDKPIHTHLPRRPVQPPFQPTDQRLIQRLHNTLTHRQHTSAGTLSCGLGGGRGAIHHWKARCASCDALATTTSEGH